MGLQWVCSSKDRSHMGMGLGSTMGMEKSSMGMESQTVVNWGPPYLGITGGIVCYLPCQCEKYCASILTPTP
jgi:hypothetical protein